jgi:hypothetical protein
MDADTVARLNVTVENFVKRCISSSEKPPFAILGDCLEELRSLPYWTEEEIERVRDTATRVLNERLSASH